MAGYNIGTAWIQVAISGSNLTREVEGQLNKVNTSKAENSIVSGLGGAFQKVGKIASGALAVAGTVGLATGFADIATQAITASDATNKFKNTLGFAGKSADDIERLTKSTKDYADKTVYGLSDIQSITAQLASNNVAGYDKLAEAAGNLNAVAGGNAETFKSVGMVLTQTAGQGKLTTENFNQLADAVPGASGKLQQALLEAGAYTGNFREAMEKGQITAEEFNSAVMDLGMTDVAKEAATSTATIEGAWGNLEAALVSGAMGIVDKIKPALTDFMGNVATGAEKAFGWINDNLIPGIQGVWGILAKGQFDGSSKLFGLEEDSGIVDFLFKIGESARAAGDWITGTLIPGIQGVASILFQGDYQGPSTLFGLEEDSAVVDWLFRIRDGAIEAGSWINNTLLPAIQGIASIIFTGDTDKPIFGLKPDSAIVSFLEGLRDAVGWVVDAGLKLSAWIVDNKTLLGGLAVTVGTAVVAFKGMQAVMAISALGGSASAILSFVTGMEAFKRATDLAKIAQAAFNVVMNANPIILVVTAIATLVAGLAWFFTQTEMGKAAWAAITAEFQKFLDWIAPYWNATLTVLGAVWNQIWSAVSGFFTSYVVPAITGAVSILGGLWSGLVWIVTSVWSGIQSAVQTVADWFTSYVVPAFEAVWTGIKIGIWALSIPFIIVWSLIRASVLLVVDWFMTYVAPVLSTVWSGIVAGAQWLWTGVQTVWDGLKSAVGVVVDWFNAYVSPVLSAVWVGIQVGAQFLWAGLVAVWNGIQSAVRTVADFFTAYVQPVISAVWTGIQVGAQFLWNGIVTIWNGIQSAIQTVVGWFQTYVQPVITAVWDGIKAGADLLWSGLQTVWNGIKDTINTVASWFRDTLKPIFDTVTTNIKTAFDNMKSGIQTVWDGVKSVAAKPINFLINTVYKDGIKKTADSIAEKLGLSLRLPDVSPIPGYASGGVLPGYSPGRDIYHFYSPDGGGAIALSGGEAIMRPEWVRAVGGPAAVHRMNAAARGGAGDRVPGGDRGVGFAAFADGGIWDKLKSTVGAGVQTASNWIATAADAVSSIISDPLGAVENLLRIPMNAALKGIPGSAFFKDMAMALPGKWVDGFGEWLKSNTAAMPVTGSATDIVNAARMAIGVPYVWGGSSIPPGLDCSGLVYWAAHQMGSSIPRLTAAGYQSGATPGGSINAPGTLLFWGHPAYHIAIASGNGMMVEAPRPGLSVRETGIWGAPSTGLYKFDSGGLLQPGLTTVLNATGKPEPVFTGGQWDKIDDLLSKGNSGVPDVLEVRDVDGVLIGRMQVEAGRAVDRVASDLSGRRIR
uniref:Tail tape measure n=1 Tax=Siphoviridae sp. ctksc2 TaxID=2825645 RepID=A0A8S5URM9_9CAUD|nr:MAG TPA: tail tape measure [Siphoviridae sp. ctksc2]